MHCHRNAVGNRLTLRKRDGRTVAFAYDALNRLVARTYPQGGARPVHYGYGLRDEQLYARFDSPSGPGITNAYDAFGSSPIAACAGPAPAGAGRSPFKPQPMRTAVGDVNS